MYSHARLNQELETFKGRYVRELNRLYGGELEHRNVLPEMARLAQTPGLKSVFQYHLEKTRIHVERLQRIFVGLGLQPADLGPGAAVTTRPSREWALTPDESAECEAVLIAAARRLEHHEIVSYLLALNCAQILRDDAAVRLLEQTLREEYEADGILATLQADGQAWTAGLAEHNRLVGPLIAGAGPALAR